MMGSHAKRTLYITIALLLIVGAIVFVRMNKKEEMVEVPTPVVEEKSPFTKKVIGTSVEGRNIEAYSFGKGEWELVFVGGIHGGYEWNSVLLAYEFLDYLEKNPKEVPENLTVTIIPSANPDGLYDVTGKEGRFTLEEAAGFKSEPVGLGRFNANNVDLNRNFACKWKPKSTWRSQEVSAGTEAFSEPEAKAIRDYTISEKPTAFIFWHSQSNAVYASECEEGVLAQTSALMTAYADAAGYPAVASFTAYPISGDAEGWLASLGIPAITVELKTHETIEWEKNLKGIKAVFNMYSPQ